MKIHYLCYDTFYNNMILNQKMGDYNTYIKENQPSGQNPGKKVIKLMTNIWQMTKISVVKILHFLTSPKNARMTLR